MKARAFVFIMAVLLSVLLTFSSLLSSAKIRINFSGTSIVEIIQNKSLPQPHPYYTDEMTKSRPVFKPSLDHADDHANETSRNRPFVTPTLYRAERTIKNGLPSLRQTDIHSIETLIFFVGWARSCHSFIGSMLDAHTNVIIAHEYQVFEQLIKNKQLGRNRSKLFNELYQNSYMTVKKKNGWRNYNMNQKGYSLHINGWWQGGFTKLKVIGDKGGGKIAKMYHRSSKEVKTVYQVLKDNVKVPIKVLQVIRNPFDMIATDTLYQASSIPAVKVRATPTQKYTNFAILNQSIESFLGRSTAIFHMVPDMKLSPLEVHCEDLISHPAETMSNIWQFLNLECSREYLQMCVDKTFRNVSASRHLVEWDPSTILSLKRNIMKFPFFQRYTNTEELL